jgi:hypothetical protein
MIFLESPRVQGYVETSRSIVLDYDVKITELKKVRGRFVRLLSEAGFRG